VATRTNSNNKNEAGNLRVAILVTDGFEEAEMVEPRKFLNKQGATTVLIAPKPGKVGAMKHDEKSKKYSVDLTLDKADPNDFDAVLLPGGALNADALRVESKAQEFVREINDAAKPIAFICHAPWLLVSAGLVNGRRLTSYHTIRDDIENAGGKWTNEESVTDANWTSSRQPDDIPAFNQAMKHLFWPASASSRASVKSASR
jgi:protease I